MTRKQVELLAFITKYMAENSGESPSFTEMATALGLRGKSGIHRIITALEERGKIFRHANRSRAIEVIAPGNTVPVGQGFPFIVAELAGRLRMTSQEVVEKAIIAYRDAHPEAKP